MTTLPDRPTEAPPDADVATDLLSDVLSRIRLSGAVFLRGEYAAPWAFDSPPAVELASLLAPDAERLILFHIVRRGVAWVEAGGRRLWARAGDLVLLPHADRHQMGNPDGVAPTPIAELLPPPPWAGVPECRFDGGGESTGVVCGYLRCDELLFNALLRRLPPLFRVRPAAGPGREWVRACVDFALDESAGARSGSAALMSRLPEMLLVEALRPAMARRMPSAGHSGAMWACRPRSGGSATASGRRRSRARRPPAARCPDCRGRYPPSRPRCRSRAFAAEPARRARPASNEPGASTCRHRIAACPHAMFSGRAPRRSRSSSSWPASGRAPRPSTRTSCRRRQRPADP
jgi:hypothetical protein